MSVSIGTQGSQIYVQLNHKGKSVQIPCKDEAEAQQVKAAAEEVEKQIAEKEKPQVSSAASTTNPIAASTVQGLPVDLTQSTPAEGVGKKLDIKGV